MGARTLHNWISVIIAPVLELSTQYFVGSPMMDLYGIPNRFLVGLNCAGVLYNFFVQKMALLVEALNILLSGIWSL